MNEPASTDSSLSVLRRFARTREREEVCDFCSAEIYPRHEHLFETDRRRLVCVCEACAILFGNQGDAKYRRVPRNVRFLRDFRLTEGQWQSMSIPIRLAFIYHDSRARKDIALYPSPAGPTESWLDTVVWEEIRSLSPELQRLEPDVEALLINRMRRANQGDEYYLAPIDECFRLSGLLRMHWRGLSGGARVWEELTRFFLELKSRGV